MVLHILVHVAEGESKAGSAGHRGTTTKPETRKEKSYKTVTQSRKMTEIFIIFLTRILFPCRLIFTCDGEAFFLLGT
jgi:hypothetical protein